MRKILTAMTLVASLPAATEAAVIYTPAPLTADGDVQKNNTAAGGGATSIAATTNTVSRIGRQSALVNRHPVYVFQLPSLGAGEVIDTANFEFTVTGGRAGDYAVNVDLWGLDFRASSAILATDHFAGASDAGATLIQDTIIASGVVSTGAVSTDGAGDAALADYLQAQYDAGGAGGFIFLRLNNDAFYATNRIETGTADNADPSLRPVLTFTTVIPEPASLVLVMCGGLCLLVRGRRGA